MKQIQFATFGQPSQVVQCVHVPDVGAPSAWEVVVDVEAFPVNPADLAMISGRYGTLPKLPATIGMEAVGVLSQVGTSVANLKVGQRVIILANNNWAERRKVPAAAVHPIPEHIDWRQAAMLKVNPATALLMLSHFGKIDAGDWVIQTAPLSSVGRCVIQIAKARGIRTINVVRREEAKSEVLELGGDLAILDGPHLAQSIRSHVGSSPIRFAMDAVAGAGTQRMAEALSDGGTIINYGMLSTEACVLAPEQTIFRGISLVGFWVSKILNRLSLIERHHLFDSLVSMIEGGKIQMPIDSMYPIDQIRMAIARAEQQTHRNGKVLVTLREAGAT